MTAWASLSLAAASALSAIFWARTALRALATDRLVDDLAEVAPEPPPGGWPSVTAVVPARDEAASVERAVRSLLSQDYPDLAVVAVDDRSEDGTGAILDRLLAEAPARLHVVHVRALPEGWLGKNHACARGAEAAQGRYLLFTDGDVVFAPTALRRAVAYAEARGLGHLAAVPHLVAPGLLERAFVATFATFANLWMRPWELRRPGTAGFVGVGAFALVLREAYRKAGGHASLRLEAVDDVKLGLVLRRSGVRQGVVRAGSLLSVRWAPGFCASWRGLLKNGFAAVEYRWPAALLACVSLAGLSVLPWVSLGLGAAPAKVLGLVSALLSSIVVGTTARRISGGRGTEGLLLPVAGPALAAALLASAAAASLRAHVTWRGTRYPLEALRRGCIRRRSLPAHRAVGWDPRWW